MPRGRAAISFNSLSTSYMMTVSVKASGASPCADCFSAVICSCSSARSTAYSSPMKQQSSEVSGQARPMPSPSSSRSAPHSARCSPPHTPQGTLMRNFSPSKSICSSLLPHSHCTIAPEAARAKRERCCITGFLHLGHR